MVYSIDIRDNFFDDKLSMKNILEDNIVFDINKYVIDNCQKSLVDIDKKCP